MVKTYISKWTYQRLIQLAIGFYFIWNYSQSEDRLSLFFGGVMLFQAVFNVGCFSSKGCSTTPTGEAAPFVKDIKKMD